MKKIILFSILSMIKGNTLTCPGFYAPQGREVRLKPKTDNYIDNIRNKIDDFPLTNMEMETAGYYAMGRLLGHKMLSPPAVARNTAGYRSFLTSDLYVFGL